MKNLIIAVIVIVVLIILGYGGYRVYHHFHRLATQPTTAAVTHPQVSPKLTASPSATQNNVYKMMSAGTLGNILTDPKGMTLYTYAKDTKGVSNCSGTCLKIWPAYTAPSQTGNFPTNISIIKRNDGTLQYAWNGMPLYYYSKDTKPGEVSGNGVAGIWSVVK